MHKISFIIGKLDCLDKSMFWRYGVVEHSVRVYRSKVFKYFKIQPSIVKRILSKCSDGLMLRDMKKTLRDALCHLQALSTINVVCIESGKKNNLEVWLEKKSPLSRNIEIQSTIFLIFILRSHV